MENATVIVSARSFGKIIPEPMQQLQDYGCSIIECREGKDIQHDRLQQAVRTADAWIVSFYPITRELLNSARNLKVIVKHGVGLDNIDLEAATARGILVAIAPGATEHAVPELTLGMLLCLARRIHEAHQTVIAGQWKRFPGVGLYGKTLGILGLGRIGLNIAMKMTGFGARLLGYDPYIAPERLSCPDIRLVSLAELYAESDFICVCAPLTSETEHILNREAFQQMKDGVIIVNTARGKIVDEDAMYAALESHKVGGYATDVFETEPPLGSPLLTHVNVLCTPHIGSYTLDSLRLIGERAAQGVLDALQGKIPEFLVNKDVLKNYRNEE